MSSRFIDAKTLDNELTLYSNTLSVLIILSLFNVYKFPKAFYTTMDQGDNIDAFIKRMAEKENHDKS